MEAEMNGAPCWLCPDIYRVKSYDDLARVWTWTCPKCKSKTMSNQDD